ncbi:uncharacterized protein LOC108624593 isoform X2 [Ceratina calcarata]|uniref:Uncharacterized protein LOC108624593 isoform X2 n=1 Tax=Ceratina calcarata TaxID=156304 RepID=A0AAJ7S179_9HYME|nr:uncharacterized protein LOC108624593 isoform X2 [Ceratina calcarata]
MFSYVRNCTFLCILLFPKFSASSKYSKLYDKLLTKSLSTREVDNLKELLNFVQRSSEFHPLTLSIVRPEFRSDFLDFFLRYTTENSIESYIVRARDLSVTLASINNVRFTWILIIRDWASLNIFIYRQRNLWRSSNRYLIIFTNEGVKLPWRDALEKLWRKYNVYRALVFLSDEHFRCLLNYMPFEVFKYGFGSVRKLCLKENSTEESGQNSLENEESEVLHLDRHTKLFEDFRNLNNYPLNVMVFESLLMNVSYTDENQLILTKPDASVLFTLEKTMGAKFRVKAMNKIKFREDPFNYSLRSIENGTVDMVITGFFIKLYSDSKMFQFTCAMYEDKLCFLAPDSGLLSKAYMPFLPFKKSLWMLLMAYDVVVTLLWYLVKYIDESLQGGSSKSTDEPIYRGEIPRCVTSFVIFFEKLCYPFERGETLSQRALLFGTLFFSLIVNGLYQSCLVSSLSKPFHQPQLNTLEDVLNSGKTVVTKYANLKDIFQDDSEVDSKLYQSIQVISQGRKEDIKYFVAYDDKISLTRYQTMELEDFDYYDEDENPLIHVVNETPMNYRISYVLRFRSPYAERVDFLLLRLSESGLVCFWFENMTHPIRLVKARRKLDKEKTWIKLAMDHYSITFLSLVVGLLGSIVVTRQ